MPLIFDDLYSITKNDSIMSLWPLWHSKARALKPAARAAHVWSAAREFVVRNQLQIGGLNPVGYHVVNIVIHYFNALLLWAITRRTLRLPYFDGRFASRPNGCL